MVKETRKDSLPEHHQYVDQGCNLHAFCLSCPFPSCRYEHSAGSAGLKKAMRDSEIYEYWRKTGLFASALAAHFGISMRVVFRALGAMRNREVDSIK